MANGFIILSDGRAYARRWTSYDLIIQLVIDGLGEQPLELAFRQFLQGLIPSPDCPRESRGNVCFVRQSDQEMVFRDLDLRGLTQQNQRLFWNALQRSYQQIRLGAPHNGTDLFVKWVQDLLRMRWAAARRASPFVDNDWSNGFLQSFDGEKIGPGWHEHH